MTEICAPVPTWVVVLPGEPVNQVNVTLPPVADAVSCADWPSVIVVGFAEIVGTPGGVHTGILHDIPFGRRAGRPKS